MLFRTRLLPMLLIFALMSMRSSLQIIGPVSPVSHLSPVSPAPCLPCLPQRVLQLLKLVYSCSWRDHPKRLMLVPCEALALVPLRALETLFRNGPRHLIMPTGSQPPSSSSLYLYSHDSQFSGGTWKFSPKILLFWPWSQSRLRKTPTKSYFLWRSWSNYH